MLQGQSLRFAVKLPVLQPDVAPLLCDDQPVLSPFVLQAANEGLERALADARRQCASVLSPKTMRGASSSESVVLQHSAAAHHHLDALLHFMLGTPWSVSSIC